MMRQQDLFAPAEIADDSPVPAVAKRARAIKRRLINFYSDESNFGFSVQGEEKVFPDTKPWFACWAWGDYVRRLHGARAWLYGFDDLDNPHSSIAADCGGHHFALLDGRFVVDGWLANVEGLVGGAAFDLLDPADALEVRRFYGPPEFWWENLRMRDREIAIDREPREQRVKALQGVAAAPRIPILRAGPSSASNSSLAGISRPRRPAFGPERSIA